MPKYIRYRSGSETRYGILEDGAVRELHGDLFDHEPTGSTHALKDVVLLAPCVPPKILAVGLNYGSHLEGAPRHRVRKFSTSRFPACRTPKLPS